jgi:hypothetical protein
MAGEYAQLVQLAMGTTDTDQRQEIMDEVARIAVQAGGDGTAVADQAATPVLARFQQQAEPATCPACGQLLPQAS